MCARFRPRIGENAFLARKKLNSTTLQINVCEKISCFLILAKKIDQKIDGLCFVWQKVWTASSISQILIVKGSLQLCIKYLYGHGHGSLMYGYRAFCQQKKKNLPKRFYFVCYKIITI